MGGRRSTRARDRLVWRLLGERASLALGRPPPRAARGSLGDLPPQKEPLRLLDRDGPGEAGPVEAGPVAIRPAKPGPSRSGDKIGPGEGGGAEGGRKGLRTGLRCGPPCFRRRRKFFSKLQVAVYLRLQISGRLATTTRRSVSSPARFVGNGGASAAGGKGFKGRGWMGGSESSARAGPAQRPGPSVPLLNSLRRRRGGARGRE